MTAAHRDPFGAKLNAIFGSGIAHFEAIESASRPEACDLIEDGHTFSSAVQL